MRFEYTIFDTNRRYSSIYAVVMARMGVSGSDVWAKNRRRTHRRQWWTHTHTYSLQMCDCKLRLNININMFDIVVDLRFMRLPLVPSGQIWRVWCGYYGVFEVRYLAFEWVNSMFVVSSVMLVLGQTDWHSVWGQRQVPSPLPAWRAFPASSPFETFKTRRWLKWFSCDCRNTPPAACALFVNAQL